ncbi:MAG: hypothetical protein RR034_05245, partial [Bacteroidales bacterium]
AKLLVYEYIPNQHYDLSEREVTFKKDSLYTDFRRQYRFHYQTIGVAEFNDSSKLIMIAEPPPYFATDSLKSIFAKFTHSIEFKHHKIGYDGRATDLLISLANATCENVDHLIKRLSKELFLSDYKPAITKLPVTEKKVYFSSSNLDYQITLYEFNEWFLENKEAFLDCRDTTQTLTISSMFEKKVRGVYFSKLPGFVAWSIAKKSDLLEQVEYIRQFTLDADLILGALADSSTLVIIGREREVPLNELPPLYVETILLLASVTEKELSQSLDINDFLAGKMNNGKDWCPTYLSKELENTEFGNLMTLTDILLKDWSERGTIEEAYYRYPKPGYYPFDKPLFRKLGLHELVYNWNTANAMYAIDLNGITLYTLNRTGSLPVSYFNSQESSTSIGYQYEQQAYHYFATLNNPDLARVVQYTALYQLFMDNEITFSGNTHSVYPKNKPFLLSQPTHQLLTLFKNLNEQEINLLSDSIALRNFYDYQRKEIDRQIRQNEEKFHNRYPEERVQLIYKEVQQNTQQELRTEIIEVKGMLNSLTEQNFKKLTQYLAYPRGVKINDRESYNILLKARQVNHLMRSIGKNNLDLFKLDLNEVKNFYVRNLANTTAPYLKTPSIIITFNDMLTTGGHNLSSKISRVNSMTHYKKSNYKPSSYPQTAPTPDKEVPNRQHTPVNAPTSNTSKPVGSTPSKTTSTPLKSYATKTVTSTASAVQNNTSKPAIRSRSSVISTAPRSQRGF